MNGGWLARLAVILTGVSLGTGLLVASPAMQPTPAMQAGRVILVVPGTSPTEGRVIPPPDVDERPASTETEVAVLAGGCFWGVQGVFQHVEGVISAVSGYAGGQAETAHYDMVATGTTGHAEAVEITFDPNAISFGQILHIYFSVAHDPTQLDRQGPDIGAQYRSTIFPINEEQARVARAYIDQLDQAEVFDAAIVTTIEPDRDFYPAEDYHQDFMELNPTHPYIVRNDVPKLEALEILFPDAFRTEPALVGEANSTG
jgi:peptide-methionine (S)-S-oxide reductase